MAKGYSIVIEGHDCSGNDFYKRLLFGFEVAIFFRWFSTSRGCKLMINLQAVRLTKGEYHDISTTVGEFRGLGNEQGQSRRASSLLTTVQHSQFASKDRSFLVMHLSYQVRETITLWPGKFLAPFRSIISITTRVPFAATRLLQVLPVVGYRNWFVRNGLHDTIVVSRLTPFDSFKRQKATT